MISSEQKLELLERARRAASFAYAPYSKFRVGSAILAGGKTYTGANVENASSGLSLCAERSALASAKSAGEKNIQAIAVACIDVTGPAQGPLMPCGACRQWMAELAPHAIVLVLGVEHEFTVEELMPTPFYLQQLTTESKR